MKYLRKNERVLDALLVLQLPILKNVLFKHLLASEGSE